MTRYEEAGVLSTCPTHVLICTIFTYSVSGRTTATRGVPDSQVGVLHGSVPSGGAVVLMPILRSPVIGSSDNLKCVFSSEYESGTPANTLR